MKSRAFGAVLCLHVCLILVEFSTAADEQPPSVTDSTTDGDDHNKLLLECQHSDYRTYIKCLKRHKRHHRHEGDGGDTRNSCFDECGIDHCETTKCVHECHKRCMKKTKETRQFITQYETTCDSGDDCTETNKSADLPTTNVTTNIDINNVIHNHIPKNDVVIQPTPGGSSGGAGGAGGPGGGGGGTNTGGGTTGGGTTSTGGGTNTCVGTIPHCCGGTLCSSGGWFGSNPGLSLVPQIQFVPQLTFGLGAASFAGFGSGLWQHGRAGGVDCSPCYNPVLRYQCDVSCYAGQGTGPVIQNMGRTPTVNTGCQSPHCVGGG